MKGTWKICAPYAIPFGLHRTAVYKSQIVYRHWTFYVDTVHQQVNQTAEKSWSAVRAQQCGCILYLVCYVERLTSLQHLLRWIWWNVRYCTIYTWSGCVVKCMRCVVTCFSCGKRKLVGLPVCRWLWPVMLLHSWASLARLFVLVVHSFLFNCLMMTP
jgi:hypothetical protein